MIVEFVMSSFLSLLDGIIGLLPEVDLPFTETLSDFAATIGSQVNGLNSFLPISEALPILGWALTVYLPFLVVFYTVRWVYSMVPVFGR